MPNAYSDQTRMGQIHGWNVYLVEEDGGLFCKIGTALTIDYRLSGLKHGNPRALTVQYYWLLSSRENARAVERRALELCGMRRLGNREWVRGSAENTKKFVDQAISEVGSLR